MQQRRHSTAKTNFKKKKCMEPVSAHLHSTSRNKKKDDNLCSLMSFLELLNLAYMFPKSISPNVCHPADICLLRTSSAMVRGAPADVKDFGFTKQSNDSLPQKGSHSRKHLGNGQRHPWGPPSYALITLHTSTALPGTVPGGQV